MRDRLARRIPRIGRRRGPRRGTGLGSRMKLVSAIAALIFVLDQLSKWLVVHVMELDRLGLIEVWPPFVSFRMAWNYGINFGLFAGQTGLTRWVLIAVALGIVAFVVFWLRRDPPGRVGQVAGGLLIGGALGNVVDRLLYGAVADFLNVTCCGIANPYAFNVADIAIFAGAVGLVLFPSARPSGGGKNGA